MDNNDPAQRATIEIDAAAFFGACDLLRYLLDAGDFGEVDLGRARTVLDALCASDPEVHAHALEKLEPTTRARVEHARLLTTLQGAKP